GPGGYGPAPSAGGDRGPDRGEGGYFARYPASTGIVTPVTCRPLSSTRESTAREISIGASIGTGRACPIVCPAGLPVNHACIASCVTIGVATPAGWMVLIRIPCGASQLMRLRMMPTTPCLLAVYPVTAPDPSPPRPLSPLVDEMRTIEPPSPRSTSSGAIAW